MNYTVKIAGLGVIFHVAACDSKSSIEKYQGKLMLPLSASANVVYLPDGGGVEFENAFVNEKEGAGWKYEFTFDDDSEVLRGALKGNYVTARVRRTWLQLIFRGSKVH